jgi:hypothetical protein
VFLHRARIAAVAVLALAGCSRSSAPTSPAAGALVHERPEHNFRFRPPGADWRRLDPAEIDPGAAVAYARSRPDLWFLVHVTRPGHDVQPDAVVASWKAQLEARASGAVQLSAAPLELRGLSGTRAVATATVQGAPVVYESWLVSRNGWLYELLAWGAVKDRTDLEREARALFGGFELIDLALRAAPARRRAKPYSSPQTGWAVDLGVPWTEGSTPQDAFPAAEYGASCGDASFVVAAVPLLGQRPPLDVAVAALVALLDVRNGEELPRRPLRVGAWSGFELPHQQKANGRWMRWRLWALVGDEAALVAAEWRPPEQPENECAEPLEKLVTARAPRLRAHDVQRKAAAARFFADVGRRLRAAGRVSDSVAYFGEAGALAPEDAGLLGDEVRVLQQMGRRDEAARRIAARIQGTPCTSALRVHAAPLLAELGRSAEAIGAWSGAFACGYRDPDALSQYLRFLEREGKLTLAFHEAEAYADPADLPRLRGQLAAGEPP